MKRSILLFLMAASLHAAVSLQYYPQENPCAALAGIAQYPFCAVPSEPAFGLLILGGTTSPGVTHVRYTVRYTLPGDAAVREAGTTVQKRDGSAGCALTGALASVPCNAPAAILFAITKDFTVASVEGAELTIGVPAASGVSPASGSGFGQMLVFTFSDPDGWQDLDVVNVLIGNSLDGRNACYLAYSRAANVLYLVPDSGGGLLPGMTLNGSGSATGNSQCTVFPAGSAAAGNGNTLTLTLNMSFSPGFGGNKILYLAARDAAQNNSGWQALGTWSVPGAASGTITAAGAAPARGSGSNAPLAFTITDTKGWQDLGVVNILINDFLDGRHACYLAYTPASNALYLVNDAGDAGGPFAGSMLLNGTGAVQNSQCQVKGAGSSAVASGNNLTLTLNVSFNGSFNGNRVVYVAGRDRAEGGNSGWQALGTWTVQ